jgi:hypothetical protein
MVWKESCIRSPALGNPDFEDFQFIEGQPSSNWTDQTTQEHLTNLQIPKSVRTLFIRIWGTTIAVARLISAPEPQPGSIIGTVVDVTGAFFQALMSCWKALIGMIVEDS